MTLQEAILSNRKHTRPGLNGSIIPASGSMDWDYTKADIMATDWTVETLKKELTGKEIRMILREYQSLDKDIIEAIIGRLGLD